MIEIHGRSEKGYLSRREDDRGSMVAVRALQECRSEDDEGSSEASDSIV